MPFKIRDCGFSHPEALAERERKKMDFLFLLLGNEAVTESRGN
jgi:hypothetical protein